jgi:hypothetical protein
MSAELTPPTGGRLRSARRCASCLSSFRSRGPALCAPASAGISASTIDITTTVEYFIRDSIVALALLALAQRGARNPQAFSACTQSRVSSIVLTSRKNAAE